MPDIPLRLDADPQWQAIHAVADAQERHVMRLVYAALVNLVGVRIMQAVTRALIRRDPDAAVAALPLEQVQALATTLEPILRDLATEGARIAQRTLRAMRTEFVVRLGSADGLPVDELASWAARHSGQMIRDVTSETRFAVRRLIEQGVHQGRAPAETAKLIAQVVGLTNRQAQAVARFRAAQEGPNADALTNRYARALLQHRSRMIARTETLAAANFGRRAQWQREMSEGLIDGGRWEREWVAIVPSDGRTCPYCEGQDGQRAPIDGVYEDGSSGPPGHPICRCTEKLVRLAP